MSRIVMLLLGVAPAAIAVASYIGTRPSGEPVAAPPASAPAPAVASAPAPPSASGPSSSAPVGAAPTDAISAKPTFDVARIDRDGTAVLAGRAAPGARIVILNGGREIATGQADARGEWVILLRDAPLAPGSHELRVVQHIEGRAPLVSDQAVLAVVPAPPAAGAAGAPRQDTIVLVDPPRGPTTLIQPGSAAGVPRAQDLTLSTLDYDQDGRVTISGQAVAGASVRAYIDDVDAGGGVAGPDGRWRIAPERPVGIGKHRLRLDRLGPDGKPVARMELAFERLATPPGPSGAARRLHVVQGDNLWNIARAHYGDGWRFTVVFEANREQIRDPNLIYPGQVFTLPKSN